MVQGDNSPRSPFISLLDLSSASLIGSSSCQVPARSHSVSFLFPFPLLAACGWGRVTCSFRALWINSRSHSSAIDSFFGLTSIGLGLFGWAIACSGFIWVMTLSGLSIVNPSPAKVGWDCGAGAGADRILSLDILGWIRSFCLVEVGCTLDGLLPVGATVRVDEGFAEAGRAGDTAGSASAMEDGRSEIGIVLTFPR